MSRCYIDGKLVDGLEGSLDIFNPGTEESVGSVSLVDESQIDDALIAADKGFKLWSGLTMDEREAWIYKLKCAISDNKDELLELDMEETGKIYSGAEEDFQMLLDCLEFYPRVARRMDDQIIKDSNGTHQNLITREPIGVVVAYLAWNFPLLNLGYKLGPALASGCSCIIKPSELTPLATLKVGEILESINFPKGVVNFVLGDVSKIAKKLNQSKITKLITLIGSTATGKRVIKDSATSIKRFSLELGGNAPAIVLKDYDEKVAAKTLTDLKMNNCGQVCVNANRVYVHENQYESFLSSAKDVAETAKPGWGTEKDANIGPLVTLKDRDRMLEIIEDALSKGARLICGGTIPDRKGYFLTPAILADVTTDMRCYKEEIFGPILPVLKYNDSTDLIKEGNDTEYGLASYLFSNDVNQIFRISKGLQFGTVCINRPNYSVELPHGGIKESGVGKDCSTYSLEEYYYIKRISISLS